MRNILIAFFIIHVLPFYLYSQSYSNDSEEYAKRQQERQRFTRIYADAINAMLSSNYKSLGSNTLKLLIADNIDDISSDDLYAMYFSSLYCNPEPNKEEAKIKKELLIALSILGKLTLKDIPNSSQAENDYFAFIGVYRNVASTKSAHTAIVYDMFRKAIVLDAAVFYKTARLITPYARKQIH